MPISCMCTRWSCTMAWNSSFICSFIFTGQECLCGGQPCTRWLLHHEIPCASMVRYCGWSHPRSGLHCSNQWTDILAGDKLNVILRCYCYNTHVYLHSVIKTVICTSSSSLALTDMFIMFTVCHYSVYTNITISWFEVHCVWHKI